MVFMIIFSYLAGDHRVSERYSAGFVQHMYVRLHVVTVDRFGRAGVQVGRRTTDHFLAPVAHSRGASTAGHPATKTRINDNVSQLV